MAYLSKGGRREGEKIPFLRDSWAWRVFVVALVFLFFLLGLAISAQLWFINLVTSSYISKRIICNLFTAQFLFFFNSTWLDGSCARRQDLYVYYQILNLPRSFSKTFSTGNWNKVYWYTPVVYVQCGLFFSFPCVILKNRETRQIYKKKVGFHFPYDFLKNVFTRFHRHSTYLYNISLRAETDGESRLRDFFFKKQKNLKRKHDR